MADIQHVGLDEVVLHFAELEDPRSTVNRQHPLVSVVVIALLAVLAGAGGPTAIAKWAALKEEFLVKVLNLPNGVPRKDVFRRVLMALKPDAFQACFANWLRSLRATAATATGVEQPILAVDGKTLRRSHDRRKGLGALHSVSVWASDFGLSLGQVACAEKSNEITAIPELLRLVDIKGAIITIDAMGTQKAIAEQIIDSDADYVLARDLLRSATDLVPDPEQQFLRVEVHLMSNPPSNRAIAHVLHVLNESEFTYWGSSLRLVYSLAGTADSLVLVATRRNRPLVEQNPAGQER